MQFQKPGVALAQGSQWFEVFKRSPQQCIITCARGLSERTFPQRQQCFGVEFGTHRRNPHQAGSVKLGSLGSVTS